MNADDKQGRAPRQPRRKAEVAQQVDPTRALLEVVAAVLADERPVPAYHRNRLARHRREWPELWRALDALLATLREARPR